MALDSGPAPLGRETAGCRNHLIGVARNVRRVGRIQRPSPLACRGAKAVQLVSQPPPRSGAQGRIPRPGGWLASSEVGMMVCHGEAAGLVAEPVEEIGSPQRPVRSDQLGGRFAAAMGMASQLSQLDPGSVFHRRVIKVYLE